MTQLAEWQRSLQMLRSNLRRRTAERRSVCEHLPECNAQRVDVRATVYFPPTELLGTRVMRSPHEYTRHGNRGVARNFRAHFDKPEVDHFKRRPIFLIERYYEVCRFDIAVNKLVLMGRRKSSGSLRSDL